ncbi:MAG: hypothetical protein COT81_04055 [Candidatus Buchananbacteria bacterium CG10_big_fil_rev_8_21_14_0_10_42_9]|uniref:DoxX family protein n=1 Tax=Candidatus Buchananbacteria bacterium CG10_big_fil_rev_8_21_14_0_10_42_9 TaxID=1974526 RepID=A0A2H0W2M1_9BACT|nr:MAG: hypothetical protein COT81_04055 [Candidatus Buchananbacteria bacterium CG10_big_fil_rev_8_21_14_0_10_42_9]
MTDVAKNISVALLRISLGWIFLWAFLDKMFGLGFATPAERAWLNGGSPTAGFLSNSPKGPLAQVFNGLAGQGWVDWLFMIGLLCLGVSLILGAGIKIAATAGTILLLLMWLAVLPPSNNPVIDDHIVYALALIVLRHLRAGRYYGLGTWWSSQPLVQKNRWLE